MFYVVVNNGANVLQCHETESKSLAEAKIKSLLSDGMRPSWIKVISGKELLVIVIDDLPRILEAKDELVHVLEALKESESKVRAKLDSLG